MRILVAVEPVDFRKGIDGLAALCRQALAMVDLKGHALPFASGYWYLWQQKERPSFLREETALNEAGGLVDQPRGWEMYADYLDWQAMEELANHLQPNRRA